MPHVYIAEEQIELLELREATSAFLERREYTPVTPPLVPRFDYVVSPFHEPPTKEYIQYGLAHMIYELWHEDKSLFAGHPRHANRLRGILKSNRGRDDYKRHGPNFQNTVLRNLLLYNIQFPEERVQELSEWISEFPSRSPAGRLGYEVFHKLLRNLTDDGEDSDIPDFAHISCTPYVDAMTLDSRMRGYVAQVDKSIGSNFSQKLYRNVKDIEVLL